MSHLVTADERDHAREIMSAKEFEAWLLIDALGWSQYQAANHLNLSRASIRERLTNARAKWLRRADPAIPLARPATTNDAAVNLVIERDGPWCYLCGAHSSQTRLTLEHIIPLSRGGTNDATNLAAACGPCNTRKGNKAVSLLVTSRRPIYYPIG